MFFHFFWPLFLIYYIYILVVCILWWRRGVAGERKQRTVVHNRAHGPAAFIVPKRLCLLISDSAFGVKFLDSAKDLLIRGLVLNCLAKDLQTS